LHRFKMGEPLFADLATLQTAAAIFRNVLERPDEPKFRTLKVANARVAALCAAKNGPEA